ncbi:MAG: phage holin family protein [Candidatus Limnocylindria bacterium]
MTIGDRPRRESAFTLVKRLLGGGVALAKLELQRGKQEMGENLGQVRSGVVLLAIAAGIGLVFLIALISSIIAALFVLGLWWVSLIILALLLLLVIALALRGIGKLRSASFTPEETIASVKEDVEWAKRLLRRE